MKQIPWILCGALALACVQLKWSCKTGPDGSTVIDSELVASELSALEADLADLALILEDDDAADAVLALAEALGIVSTALDGTDTLGAYEAATAALAIADELAQQFAGDDAQELQVFLLVAKALLRRVQDYSAAQVG